MTKTRFERWSIDPGLEGTGIAHWEDDQWSNLVEPTDLSMLTAPHNISNDWQKKTIHLAGEFESLVNLNTKKLSAVYCEVPQLFMSARGFASAVKGDIFKLMFLIGHYAEICRKANVQFNPVGVDDWKGQLTKDATELRICRRLPYIVHHLKPKTHQWDAIGIGLYSKGHF